MEALSGNANARLLLQYGPWGRGEACRRESVIAKLRTAVCPSCGKEVTVTYWPYNAPLYTVHLVGNSNRDCRQSLRAVVDESGTTPRKLPAT